MADKLLTAEQAAGPDYLHSSRTKVFEWMASGELRSIKLGRSRRVPESAIEDFIKCKLAEQTNAR